MRKKINGNFSIKKGFTLAELLISVVIGSTVLIFVFSFVIDAIDGLAETNERTKVINQFYEFVTKMDNFKNTFVTGSLVQDSPANTGFDILMLTDYTESAGVLIAVVDLQNFKPVPNSQYNYYTDRVLGYRELTATNITAINGSPSSVYDYQFFEDKIFNELKVKDFQASYYNSGDILDMEAGILLRYKSGLLGNAWSTIPYADNIDLFRVNLNF